VSQMEILRVAGGGGAMAAVCTAFHHHGLETCTVCRRLGNILKNDKAILTASVLN